MDYLFEKGKFTESELENAFIELFQNMGYDYVSGSSMHRTFNKVLFNEVLIEEDLIRFLLNRYRNADLTDLEMKRIINTIKLIPSNPIYSGNRETFWLISEGFDLTREDSSKIALHVDYVDFDHPENNIFKVVNQYTVSDKKTRRPDMLLFINGIPLGIFEYKSA